jgi:hypothetical protein
MVRSGLSKERPKQDYRLDIVGELAAPKHGEKQFSVREYSIWEIISIHSPNMAIIAPSSPQIFAA